MYMPLYIINSLRPRQNGRYFVDDSFKRILLNENGRIWIKNSLKFVPKGPINNIPALVQIMAWRRRGDKPLSEPMIVSLSTHICVTRPQWVKLQLMIKMRVYMWLETVHHTIIFVYINFFDVPWLFASCRSRLEACCLLLMFIVLLKLQLMEYNFGCNSSHPRRHRSLNWIETLDIRQRSLEHQVFVADKFWHISLTHLA